MIFPLTRILFYMAVEEAGRKRITALGAFPFFVAQLSKAVKYVNEYDDRLTCRLVGPLNGSKITL